MSSIRVLILLGPTAVGKSSFLYNQCRDLPLYVVSADAIQVYRDCDILSATPTQEQLETFPHAGINELDPGDRYDVNKFLNRVRELEETLRQNNRLLTLVGGTPLYLKAYLYGLDELPPSDEEFRTRMRNRAQEQGREIVHEELQKIDPESAKEIHPNDLKRTIRALEIHHQTGKTKSELTAGPQTLRDSIDPTVVGLNRPAEELRNRINRRVDEMFENGVVREVRGLLRQNPSRTLRQAIGFSEIAKFIEQGTDRKELKQEIQSNTWEYARKQMTWYRNFPVQEWFHPTDDRKELIEFVDDFTKRKAS